MSAAVVAAAAAALSSRRSTTTSATRSTAENYFHHVQYRPPVQLRPPLVSRYENLKRRDWDNFRRYLRTRRPTLSLTRCSGANVVEFLSYLDEFGQMKVHVHTCPNYGQLYASEPCPCPVRQAWSSLVALIGRLRIAFEENGGSPVMNPFNAVDVWVYLNGVKDAQDKSRGIKS